MSRIPFSSINGIVITRCNNRMAATTKVIFLVTAILGFSIASLAQAEIQTFNASIRFLEPLNFANTTNPSFGDFEAGALGRNFVLGTDGSISGTDADAYAGGANAGSIEIHGSAFNNIDIVAQNLADDGGVSITTITCDYGGTGSVDCVDGISAAAAPTDTGTTLLLGLGVNTTTEHTDGNTAAPTFDIVVTYN